MARPSRTGSKKRRAKARNASLAKGRKTPEVKQSIAPAASRVKRRSVSGPSEDLKEAREQQAATAEILKVIASSPGDVQPVFDVVARHAAGICGAQFVDIIVVQGDALHQEASYGNLKGLAKNETVPLDRTTVMGRSICDGKPVHIADILTAGNDFPVGRQLAARFGHRTTLAVPLLREGRALGTILVRRIPYPLPTEP